MMNRATCIVGLAVLTFSPCVMPEENWQELRAKAFPVSILVPGSHHGDEVRYSSGPGWYALVVSNGAAKLEPVTLKVRWVYDPVLDGEDKVKGPYSGKDVSFYPQSNAAILLKGNAFRVGEVQMASLIGESAGLAPKTYTLGNRRYSLRLNNDCGKNEISCRWVLSDGVSKQALHELYVQPTSENELDTDSTNTGVIWAGDLDGDDKLDLILDVSNHYNAVAQIRVFLSTAAKKGQLVGKAGWFSAVGC